MGDDAAQNATPEDMDGGDEKDRGASQQRGEKPGKRDANVRCPFCAEDILAEAIVCKHCRRDLTIPKPLMDANRTLTARVATLEAEIEELKSQARWRILKKPAAALPEPEGATSEAPHLQLPPSPPGIPGYAISYFLLPVLALLATHYLMIMKFDFNPLYLRAASIFIPTCFGVSLYRRTAPRLLPSFVMGALCGLTAVSGMLTVVGVIDKVSIIPADMVEWREAVEYALSIALAFVLGALLGQTWKLLRTKVDEHVDQRAVQALALGLVGDLARLIVERAGLGDRNANFSLRMLRIVRLVNAAMAAATAAGSIFAGIKAFL
jgi:hypothetical protein